MRDDPPRILIPELRTREQYFMGLHEFGHFALGHRGWANLTLDPGWGLGRVLYEEAAAYVWALEHARFPATPTVTLGILNTMASHRVIPVGAPLDSHSDHGAERVPAELRDEYRANMARLETAHQAHRERA